MAKLQHFARTGAVLAFAGLVGARGSAQAPPHVPGRLLVQFSPKASAQQVRDVLASANARITATIPHIGVHTVQLPQGANDVAMMRAFAQRPEVVFAELDLILRPASAIPNDPMYSSEWHLPKIGCPTAWSTTTGSSSVIVAILDTGCDPTHPELSAKYVPGWNFYDNNSDTHDVYNHGTPVAGTVGACSNNGSGVASVAWGCKIMPIRISDVNGNASSSAMANGITWAADHGARVANVSFNNVGWLTAVKSAAQYMQSKGGVVVSSAGNSGVALTYADNPYVMTVSATDSTDAICSFSNTGTPIDLAAPGYGIYTTSNGGSCAGWAGTSFSSPIVAGVAALMISANPNLTGQQVHDMLEQSADDLGSAGWDSKYGYGRVNAAKAVAMAMSTTSDITPPTVSISAPAAGATVAGTVTVQTKASDNVGVSSVSYYLDSATTPMATVASPYSMSWDTTKVANGSHTITAVAVDPTGNTGSGSVSVTVSNTVAPANQAPTVASSPSASSNPVTGTTVGLSVLGADDGGESNLVYTWSAAGPAAVSFSANGTNAAKSVTAGFSKAGSYTFTVTIKDTAGLTVSSSVSVTVNQTATSVSVSPASASVAVSQSQQFSASFKDQFGSALAAQPAIAWSVSGGGAIGPSGLFTASTAGGPFSVTASAVVNGSGSVTVTAPPPPADTTAPTVSITSPTGGTVSSTVTVNASATDDVGVVKVELWVDGKLQSTDTASPWTFSVNTKGWKRGTHKLVCKAYDAAGNVGTSATVTVSK